MEFRGKQGKDKQAEKEKRKAEKAEEKERKKQEMATQLADRMEKEHKLNEYDYYSKLYLDTDDKDFLKRIEAYEKLRDAEYMSLEEEKVALLRFMALQSMLILGELKKINYNIPED